MGETETATARREMAARRRAQAFRMRREGATFEAIATRLGVTRQSAQRMVARELRASAAEESADDRRRLHAEALMDVWRALHARAAAGEVEAIDRFLRVEERLAALLGLDRRDAGAPDVRLLVADGGPARAADEGPRRFRRGDAEGAGGLDALDPFEGR